MQHLSLSRQPESIPTRQKSSPTAMTTFFDALLEFIGHYPQYLWLLAFAGFFYLILWLLVHYISPSSLANWLFPDSYLLVQIILFAGNFCAATFVSQSHHFGLWFSLVAMVAIFFKFAHFVFTFPLYFSLFFTATFTWVWIFHPFTRQQN
ncbi:hypothetical protein IJJ27_03075 [bacterium]|nr:hypothetical protein [bacterium]MBQ6436516.1 hypothetical protein [bacterium]